MGIEDLKKIVRDQFDPVAQEFNLRGPTEVNDPFFISYYYFGDDVGLKVNVDMPDVAIFALVFRNKNDNADLGFGYFDDRGRRKLMYIDAALKELGLSDGGVTQQVRSLMRDHRNYPRMAEKLARLVRDNWRSIASQHEKLFPDRWMGSN
jgi:hypothetical protein